MGNSLTAVPMPFYFLQKAGDRMLFPLSLESCAGVLNASGCDPSRGDLALLSVSVETANRAFNEAKEGRPFFRGKDPDTVYADIMAQVDYPESAFTQGYVESLVELVIYATVEGTFAYQSQRRRRGDRHGV